MTRSRRQSSLSVRQRTNISWATPSCLEGNYRWKHRFSRIGKIVIPSNTELVNVIGEMAGILPFQKGKGSSADSSQITHGQDSGD